jgi:hypothetical protein
MKELQPSNRKKGNCNKRKKIAIFHWLASQCPSDFKLYFSCAITVDHCHAHFTDRLVPRTCSRSGYSSECQGLRICCICTRYGSCLDLGGGGKPHLSMARALTIFMLPTFQMNRLKVKLCQLHSRKNPSCSDCANKLLR